MPQSLLDQLLALGLAREEQRPENRKAAAQKKKQRNKNRKPRRPQKDAPKAAKSPRTPAPGRGQHELSPEERALRQKVHKLITDTHLERGEDAQVPFHFVKGSRVKRIYVTAPQREGLAKNELAVAAMKGRHYIIPIAAAREIREQIPAYFLSMGDEAKDMDMSKVDDEYSDYQVPDDLMW